MTDLHGLLRKPSREPSLQVSESDLTLDRARESAGVSPIRELLDAANVIFIPDAGRDGIGPTFASGTEQLFKDMRENAPGGMRIEIAVRDEDYQELALYDEWAIISTIVTSSSVAVGVVQLVAQFLFAKLGKKRAQQTNVKATFVVVDEQSGKSKAWTYEGPVSSFSDMLKAQMEDEARSADD